MNKVILIGRVGKDVETKEFENDNFVSNFTLATSEKYKNKSGEMVENTEWHNVTVWNSVFAKQYVKKGDLVSVEGKIQTRMWETDAGEKRYSTEINAIRIDGLSSANKEQNQQPAKDDDDNLPF